VIAESQHLILPHFLHSFSILLHEQGEAQLEITLTTLMVSLLKEYFLKSFDNP